MKNIITIISVFCCSIMATYAYNQQSVTAYANTPNNNAGMSVSINNYVTALQFNATWSATATAGSTVAYGDELIGEYSWWTGSGDKNYFASRSYRYWGDITVYINVSGPTGASGTATLSWWL